MAAHPSRSEARPPRDDLRLEVGDIRSVDPIDDGLRDRIKEYAVRAYNAVGAEGVARVDFMYADGELYVNEINTVPGSLAAYFYDGGTSEVVEKMLDAAVKTHNARRRLKYVYKQFRGEGAKK